MRFACLAAAPLLLLAAPASATQGFACRTIAPEGVNLTIVIGTGIGGGLVGATLRDGERLLSTFGEDRRLVTGQSWVDDRALLLDLLSADGSRRVARLRVGLGGALESRNLTGTLDYGGRISRIVCRPD